MSVQNPETLQTLPLKINPELFLDTLLMEIRRDSILFSAEKKRNRLAEEQILINDIEILETQAQNSIDPVNITSAELDRKRQALEKIYNYQAQGAYIRSRAAYKMDGERPTKMFCALEKYNGVQKYVPQLFVNDENDQEILISDQQGVENEIFRFYNQLYENRDSQLEFQTIEQFMGINHAMNFPKLNESQKNSMEGKITLDEMTKYLKKTKNNVSPGSSGFTNEFYKFFWRNIKHFVINAVEFAFENNRLGVTQNLGIISIIPKGEKDKRYLNNWRPLTLLNTLYKLVSGCIAERIKPALSSIIHPDQKGFVAGRYIGEAIRTTYDIMHYAKEKNLAGLLLCIDFEKAYDSISFKYISKVLKFFNFSDCLINWVEILLYDFSAVINHCGNISKSFRISRGCRQGDPIASYLFILCIEILAIKLRSDPGVEGFRVGNTRHLMEIYADDLTIFLEPNSTNLRNIIQILTNFYKLSGLKISVTKTTAVWFGKEHNSNTKLCADLTLKWAKSFTLLGINFDNFLENMQNNFDEKISKIEKLLSSWSYRHLTPFGKVTIVKSLGLSKISHIALVIPNPNKDMLKRLNTLFFQFIWNKKSEKVNREDAKLPVKLGGLGMPDILKFWSAFKFSWLRRLISTDSFWPQILQTQISEVLGHDIDIVEILQLGASKLNQISKLLKNSFWKQVLGTAIEITEGAAFCFPEKLLTSPFFHNNLVLRNNKVIKERDFPEIVGRISTLSDFYYQGTNQIMQWEDFCERYASHISNEKFIDIRYVLSLSIQKLKIANNRVYCASYPQKPFLIDMAFSTTKGCSSYYKILTEKSKLKNKMHLRELKWHNELGSQFSINFWNNSRRLCANITFDNNLKWLQFQINRNSLQTNYIVSHFKRNVSQKCQYCSDFDELVSHLFWTCRVVKTFLNEVFILFSNINFDYNPSKTQMLFGFHDLPFSHPKNYITIIIKKYIWATKFKSCQLNLNVFKSLLKSYIIDLKYIYVMLKKENNINEWNTILNTL